MPLDADLVESLAALAPRSTASRPLSLAEALAAMQSQSGAITQTPTRPLYPAPQVNPTPAESPPARPEAPAARRSTDGLVRIRVPDAEPTRCAPNGLPPGNIRR